MAKERKLIIKNQKTIKAISFLGAAKPELGELGVVDAAIDEYYERNFGLVQNAVNELSPSALKKAQEASE